MKPEFQRGDFVMVKVLYAADCPEGGEVKRRVWDVRENQCRVVISDEENYQKLLRDEPALGPLAFHSEDVRALRPGE